MKSSVVKQVKELTITFPPDMLKPNADADVIFSALDDVATACRNYGRVSTRDILPDPLKCHVTGNGIEETVTVGEMSTAVLQVVNFNDQPYEEPIMSSECELVSELIGTRTRGSVERRGQSQYEIRYQPTIKGRHQLHVRVEGQHIRESPFTLLAKSPVEKVGLPLVFLHGISRPCGIDVTSSGAMIIAENGGNCVSVFGASSEKLRTFGTGQGPFWHPRGLATDNEGNILVADGRNSCIQKFTPEGQFLTAVGTYGTGPLEFDLPTDIAFNTVNNKVYVTDSSGHEVQVLNPDLTFSSSFGKQGGGDVQLNSPRGIACDSTGNVYVADCNSHCIQVFTAGGNFLRMLGKRVDGTVELKSPVGVAIDSNDMVYVSEQGNFRVSVFTSEGELITSFGSRGDGLGQFLEPRGIAVDKSGVVYVCDRCNNCVQVF